MLVIKIEMWPGGDSSRAVEFARGYIANQVSTTAATNGARGDYSVDLRGGVYGRQDLAHQVWRKSRVLGFDRQRCGAWHLLMLAIQACLREGSNSRRADEQPSLFGGQG
jgi:hypothetical protein